MGLPPNRAIPKLPGLPLFCIYKPIDENGHLGLGYSGAGGGRFYKESCSRRMPARPPWIFRFLTSEFRDFLGFGHFCGRPEFGFFWPIPSGSVICFPATETGGKSLKQRHARCKSCWFLFDSPVDTPRTFGPNPAFQICKPCLHLISFPCWF